MPIKIIIMEGTSQQITVTPLVCMVPMPTPIHRNPITMGTLKHGGTLVGTWIVTGDLRDIIKEAAGGAKTKIIAKWEIITASGI